MKAQMIVFPKKEHFDIEEIEIDEHLQDDQVLLKNKASIISAGTELAMYMRLHLRFDAEWDTWAKYPFNPGYSAVGEVLATGSNVQDFAVGDLVHHMGKHSTYAKSSQEQCVKVPEDCEAETATFYSLVHHSITALRVAPIRFGENVVVVGMGLIGNLAAQEYRLAGAGVVAGADLSTKRLDIAEKSGAIDLAFCVREKGLSEWVKELDEYGADVIIDAVSTQEVLDACVKAVADRGRVVILGCPRTPIIFDAYFDIHVKGTKVIGANTENVEPGQRIRDRALLMSLLSMGKLNVGKLISHRIPFERAQSAYEGLRDRPDDYLGVILQYPK